MTSPVVVNRNLTMKQPSNIQCKGRVYIMSNQGLYTCTCIKMSYDNSITA